MGKSTINETWSGERSAELVSTRETRNPKPTLKTWLPHRTDRNPKHETRNPKPTAKLGFELRNPKPEPRNPKPTLIRLGFPRIGRNPKPETRNRLLKLVSNDETRNPKPETDYQTLRIPMTQFTGENLSWQKKPVIWRFDVLTLWSAIFPLNVQWGHSFILLILTAM